jgi:hypothetical protein
MRTSNLKFVEADDRRSPRSDLSFAVNIDAGPGRVHAATVHNVSAHGVLVEASDHYVPGRPLVIEIAPLGRLAARVAWMRDGHAGLAFVEPLTLAQIEALFRISPTA